MVVISFDAEDKDGEPHTHRVKADNGLPLWDACCKAFANRDSGFHRNLKFGRLVAIKFYDTDSKEEIEYDLETADKFKITCTLLGIVGLYYEILYRLANYYERQEIMDELFCSASDISNAIQFAAEQLNSTNNNEKHILQLLTGVKKNGVISIQISSNP